jgi:hypothetical protein
LRGPFLIFQKNPTLFLLYEEWNDGILEYWNDGMLE